jgi:UDP-MurNAc hydroxylase
MAVFDNENEVIVNTNDCPYLLSNETASIIKSQYQKIDMLLVGYTSASAFPQCFNISEDQKILEKKRLQNMYVEYAEKYVKLFNPQFFFPFAGRYALAGKLAQLNIFKGAYELEEAYEYFLKSYKINLEKNKCIILNSGENFDISSGKSSKNYKPINLEQKNSYIENVLSTKKLDYEYENQPTIEEIISKIPQAYSHFEMKRKQLQFSSDTKIIIKISNSQNILISCEGGGFKLISDKDLVEITNFVKMELDLRLLKWILDGPRFAVWNNAEIGSHIKYQRNPEKYERGLYYCLSYFHS